MESLAVHDMTDKNRNIGQNNIVQDKQAVNKPYGRSTSSQSHDVIKN